MSDLNRDADDASAAELLKGAIDIHHHGYPEIALDVKTWHDDVDELNCAAAAGMSAILFKSHMWPSMGRVYHLRKAVSNIAALSSITLNPIAGGFSPLAVEAAGRLGASAVFMPTWGAAHDIKRKGFSAHLRHMLKSTVNPHGGLEVLDEKGKVKTEVKECLAVAAQFGLMVGTGHIAPRESIALAGAAKDYGINSIFFQHPDSNSTAATREEIHEMAALDAIIEICALGMLPPFHRLAPKTAIEIISQITPQKAVLTTDYFFEWAPPSPDTLRMIIGIFRSLGVSAADIRLMVRANPRKLLAGTWPKDAEA
jgi:hypothetical protein